VSVFVTGGTGFIGRHLVQALVQRGVEVAALVRSPDKAAYLRELQVREVPGDLDDEAALCAGCAGRQVIYHVAGAIKARDEAGFRRANEEGTARLVRAAEAAGSPRFVLVSSMAAGGPAEPGRPLRGDEPPAPVTAYGRSKLGAEAVVRASRLPWTILRPPLVYGPHDSEFLPVFKAARRGFGVVFGDGEQELSGVYGPDLVEALLASAEVQASIGRLYYPCHTERFSSRRLVLAAGRALGRDPRILAVPAGIARPALQLTGALARLAGRSTVLNGDKANEFLARAWTGDPSALTRDTGWAAKHDLSQGMRLTASWYREAGWV
jgi:nucleoside-diphosphate-sugar epimerase